MHKVVDPQDAGDDEASAVLEEALPKLSDAAGAEVTGSLGDAEPLMAIQDAINLGNYDEIIISTLPRRVSRWLKLDLVSKTRGSACRSPTSMPTGCVTPVVPHGRDGGARRSGVAPCLV